MCKASPSQWTVKFFTFEKETDSFTTSPLLEFYEHMLNSKEQKPFRLTQGNGYFYVHGNMQGQKSMVFSEIIIFKENTDPRKRWIKSWVFSPIYIGPYDTFKFKLKLKEGVNVNPAYLEKDASGRVQLEHNSI